MNIAYTKPGQRERLTAIYHPTATLTARGITTIGVWELTSNETHLWRRSFTSLENMDGYAKKEGFTR